MKNKYDSIEGFEELDVKFYFLKVFKEKRKTFCKWELVTTAKEVELKGFEDFTLFMSKYTNPKGVVITNITEALSGNLIYASRKEETRAETMKNSLEYLKKYKITKEKLSEMILSKINTYGVSKKYRA